MPITVRIPSVLRPLTKGEAKIPVNEDGPLGEAIVKLSQEYPGLGDRLLDESGSIREFINIFVNGEDVRFLDGVGTVLHSGDEVSIVPAAAGG